MFFLFPYTTDAPVYYWPFATLGLIMANALIFVGMQNGMIANADEWVLWYGEGLHPIQWVTNIFTHSGLSHIIGNMLFLWIFGIIAEGKLGWWKFLSCYLGIGVVHSMLEQMVMLQYTGNVPGAVGASAAIFGIMALATIWAPLNEMTFFYIAAFRTGTFEVSIAVMAFCYTMWELAYVVIFGTAAASSLLHLTGFLVGLPLGIALLKLKAVDCEGWDAFHVWSGDYGGFKKEPDVLKESAELAEKNQARDGNQLVEAKAQLRHYLQAKNPVAALLLYEKMRHVGGGLVLDRDELFALIKHLQATNRFRESAPLMAELIRRFPDGADAVRVKLAQLCVVQLDRPAKALELLSGIDPLRLPAPQMELAKKIAAKAHAMQADGDVELDTEL
ncbi:MAG: rhomboid family intramembrane serine protease [Pirellulales bacterium]